MADVFEFYGTIKAMKETDKLKPDATVTKQTEKKNKTTNNDVESGLNRLM